MDINQTSNIKNSTNTTPASSTSVAGKKELDVYFADELKNIELNTLQEQDCSNEAENDIPEVNEQDLLNTNNYIVPDIKKKNISESENNITPNSTEIEFVKTNSEEKYKNDKIIDKSHIERQEEFYPQNIAENKSLHQNNNYDIENEAIAETKVDNTFTEENKTVDTAINGLNGIVLELNQLNQKDDKPDEEVKTKFNITDTNNNETKYQNKHAFSSEMKTDTEAKFKKEEKNEDKDLIDNNNMNIQEPQSNKLNTQMGTNMSFNDNGQAFSEFMKKEESKTILKESEHELDEDKAILSTMEENIAIANKNMLVKENKNENQNNNNIDKNKTVSVKNVISEPITETEKQTDSLKSISSIKEVNTQLNLTTETVVKYDTVIMDKNDVDFFINLVNNGSATVEDIQKQGKSSQVSKILADLIAKAMNENKPVRIDFDNDISVIIKIDRAGKISADFLPSSQIAETYLKENLPLLRQRFNDNNIDYNELNQRKQKQDSQDNRKKGRKNE